MQMLLHNDNYRNIFMIKRIKLMKITFSEIIFPCNFYNILKKAFYLSVKPIRFLPEKQSLFQDNGLFCIH